MDQSEVDFRIWLEAQRTDCFSESLVCSVMPGPQMICLHFKVAPPTFRPSARSGTMSTLQLIKCNNSKQIEGAVKICEANPILVSLAVGKIVSNCRQFDNCPRRRKPILEIRSTPDWINDTPRIFCDGYSSIDCIGHTTVLGVALWTGMPPLHYFRYKKYTGLDRKPTLRAQLVAQPRNRLNFVGQCSLIAYE
uniref:Uncharacterized protein n=1 Tax=Timema cristinae TaxID=61476 RepID=A0A7R9D5B5_TIMCR|nr:unnamed protein product [Timema cristinae]